NIFPLNTRGGASGQPGEQAGTAGDTAEASSMPSSSAFSPIEEVLADMRAGRMVIILDDEDRENEGDFIMAAEHATPEAMAFMIRYSSALPAVTMRSARVE